MIKNPTYKFYEYNHLRADGTTSLRVAAVSSFAGKSVRAYADCHPNDESQISDIEPAHGDGQLQL